MAGVVPYENITSSANAKYTQAGWTAVKKWIFDGCDMSDPDSTLTTILQSSFLPSRGDAHPSGEDMQADEISGDAITSNQIAVTVTYKKLSALEMEPSDAQPALMTIGSSVQSHTTSEGKGQDIGPMVVKYVPVGGSIPFFVISNISTGTQIVGPTSFVKGEIQIPNTVIHFARREKDPPTAKIKAYVGMINGSACQWGAFTADNRTLLCTRIEGTTNDGGKSYVVEYEFQYAPDSWNLNAFYTLPVGTVGNSVDGSGFTCGAGNIPTDADFETFQVYDEADFNTLSLYGVK